MRALKPGGYGRRVWPNEPFAERLHEPSALVERPLSDDDWASLLEAGYYTEHHLTLDGIPWVFPERVVLDVYGREVQPPPDYSVCPALFVDDSMEWSIDADREGGVAAGRLVDFILAWQALEDAELTSSLFQAPSLYARLTSNVSSATATSLEVDATAGFEAGTGYYVGFEYIIPAGLDTSSFEGVRRGVCGRPYFHTSQPGSGFRYITDRPMFWVRRRVVLWEQLVSPEGRALGGAYATVGTYVRQAWAGYLESDPEDEALGMRLSALPLVRLLAEEVGVKMGGEISFDAQGFPCPLGFDATDQIRVREEFGSMADSIGPNRPGDISIGSLTTWCAIAQQNIEADVTPDTMEIRADPNTWALRLKGIFDGETYHGFTVYPSCWFLPQQYFEARAGDTRGIVDLPLDMNRRGCWVSVRLALSESAALLELPSSGTAVLEVGGVREMVTWDEVRYLSQDDPRVAIRLSGRAVGGTTLVDWTLGGTFTVVTGASGSWRDVLLTLATSSGLGGARGAYDTLPEGFGLGLDLDDFDFDSLGRVNGPEIDIFAEERTSIADLLGGWAAIQRKCLVQRVGEDGRVRIALVSTEPAAGPGTETIDKGDVLLGGHDKPRRVPAPTSVKVEAGLGSATRTYIVQGKARAQAGGATTWTFKAPGMSELDAINYGGNLMRIALGQATVTIDVPPKSRLQVGDTVVDQTRHPLVYAWSTGTRAPDSINAIVVGASRRLAGHKRLTLLLAGLASEVYLLAPAPVLTHIAGDRHVFRIDRHQADWFRDGEDVHIYNPGGEAGGEAQDNTIDTIEIGETEAVITIANPVLGSWAVPWVTRMTFPSYGDASSRQSGFMYVRANRYWR